MVRRFTVTAATFGAALVLVPAAHAAPPSCTQATLTTPVNTVLVLPDPPCTGMGTAPQVGVTLFPEHGSLGGPPYFYRPDTGFHSFDIFAYTITNTETGETSAPTTVTVVVDSAPTCTDGTATTRVGVALRIHDFPCADVDDRDLSHGFVDGAHGLVDYDPATGDLIYTPSPGYVGTDSFRFNAMDPLGLESPRSTMTITMVPAPLPTVAPTPVPPAAPVGTPAPDRTAPNVAPKRVGRPALAKGVSLALTSDEAGTARLKLTVDKATARKLGLSRRAKRRVTVGTATAILVDGTTRVTVKFSRKARHAFRKARNVKLLLTVVAADAAGNTAIKTLAVTLRP
jgi:hypothetical protein